MKKTITTLLAAAAMTALPALPAQAQPQPFGSYFETGNSLYEMLLPGPGAGSSDYTKALMYIRGVTDATSGIHHCTPPNTTTGQLADIVQIHLRDTPQGRGASAGLIVLVQLRKHWPCAKSTQQTY